MKLFGLLTTWVPPEFVGILRIDWVLAGLLFLTWTSLKAHYLLSHYTREMGDSNILILSLWMLVYFKQLSYHDVAQLLFYHNMTFFIFGNATQISCLFNKHKMSCIDKSIHEIKIK